MTAIYGLYETPQGAQRAFDRLRAEGLSTHGITIISSEPHEEWEFASENHRTVMPWIAVAGAAIGLASAYLLTALTQQSWPINTGGMPIVTNWTNIIIMFELTMLGAVLATVLMLFVTAKLPAKLPKIYDPAVSDGKILVGVADPAGSRLSDIERALHAGQPVAVHRMP
jgi:hypothetical protein